MKIFKLLTLAMLLVLGSFSVSALTLDGTQYGFPRFETFGRDAYSINNYGRGGFFGKKGEEIHQRNIFQFFQPAHQYFHGQSFCRLRDKGYGRRIEAHGDVHNNEIHMEQSKIGIKEKDIGG